MNNSTSRISLFLLAFMLPLALLAHPGETELEGVEALMEGVADVQVTTSQKTVHVKNAMGEKLEVFNVTGVCVASVRIDSNDKQITLNVEKGIYILRVGNVTRKVKLG